MKTKTIIIIVSVTLNLLLGFIIVNEKFINEDTPTDLGLSFKEAVRTENYRLTRTLIAQERKEFISDETLNKVNEIMGAHTSYKTYELLEFDNDEMVLLNLTPNEEYKIQDVTIVPEEFKKLFK